MTDDRSLERAARSWLEEGPTRAPDRPVEAALARIQTTPQERDLQIPWRSAHMITNRLAIAAAVVLAIITGALMFDRLRSPVGNNDPTATPPTTSATPNAVATGPAYGPGWHDVGRMSAERTGEAAVVLADGRVLLVAGTYYGFADAAELFDPGSERWSLTAPLAQARGDQLSSGAASATLLRDGRVLVIGASASSDRSAEIYDPRTDTWTVTAPPVGDGNSAVLLADGNVLVAGGMDPQFHLVATAEIFDPSTGSWTETGSMTENRIPSTMTLLTDGRVLVVGGSGGTGPDAESIHDLATAELYDPKTRSWSATPPLADMRCGSTATLLSDGRVLVAGGYGCASGPYVLASAEVYDPSRDTWTPTAEMNAPRGGASATLLTNGSVLVLGGVSDSTTDDSILASAELFDPRNGTWTPGPSMAQARYRHLAVLLLDGTVLVAGGKETMSDYALRSAERFVPAP